MTARENLQAHATDITNTLEELASAEQLAEFNAATIAAKDAEIAIFNAHLSQLANDKTAVRVSLLSGALARPDDLIFMYDTSGPYAALQSQLTIAEAEIARLTALIPAPKFRMFDATVNHILGPNYETMPLLAESRLFPTTARGKADLAYIKGTTMPRWRKENPTAPMIVVDYEEPNTLDPGDTKAVTEAEIADYVSVVKVIKEFDPTLKVSIYGLPLRSQNHGPDGEAAWIASLAHFKPLMDVMDFITISLYPLTSNLATYIWYLGSNLRMGRTYSGSKPLYPFISPMFHKNAKDPTTGLTLYNTPIPATFMTATLEACKAQADGFCHWQYAANTLNKTQAWYPVMEDSRLAQ